MSDRELTMDDYLAMLRRRLKVILIPALVAPLAGFAVSYWLPAKYSSTSTVLVEDQKVPDKYVTPVITTDFAQRVQTLSQRILTPNVLRPVVHSLNLAKPEDEGKLMNEISQNMQVEPVITAMASAVANSPTAKIRKPTASGPLPGFNVIYTDSNGPKAKKICDALTSLMINENLKSRSEIATSTTDFLARQLDDAKRAIDDQDAKLAAFKRQYAGQLPTDVENNQRMLASLNSQLDASTQTLSRAQQDKAYTESVLAQQLAVWKSSLSSTNPQTLEQQLNQLQALLLQLQSRYTEDYPDVIKTKASIAEVQKKLKEVNDAAASPSAAETNEKVSSTSEPPEIRQLRLQLHQYQNVIEQANSDQKKLQSSISAYQRNSAMSPAIEEEYNVLTRDNATSQAFYRELLGKRTLAGMGLNMENQQEGERMYLAAPANLPESPSFPIRPLLAAGGMGVGLALGALIGMILEFSDKSIRTEKDAAASMDLPLLISVPWLGEGEDQPATNGNNGRRRFWGGSDSSGPKDREHVEV